MGVITSRREAVLVRVDSATSHDYTELEIVSRDWILFLHVQNTSISVDHDSLRPPLMKRRF